METVYLQIRLFTFDRILLWYFFQDADKCIKDDKKYHKGLYQRAEALYTMGKFEMGLGWFPNTSTLWIIHSRDSCHMSHVTLL